MLMGKIFLAILGLAYLGLACWCILKPDDTARAIGFQLAPGSGQSEYLTVYGGLQIGLGLAFLLPWIFPSCLTPTLLFACLIHAAIVVCRVASFLTFADIQPTTFYLAGLELVILVLCLTATWWVGDFSPPL